MPASIRVGRCEISLKAARSPPSPAVGKHDSKSSRSIEDQGFHLTDSYRLNAVDTVYR
ncbi:hypothetical protein HDU67_005317 [Dinochytrium kinnereticum]|nr:hypothetical protein HDU67_005317 [Dinochytrium kinnereticum]